MSCIYTHARKNHDTILVITSLLLVLFVSFIKYGFVYQISQKFFLRDTINGKHLNFSQIVLSSRGIKKSIHAGTISHQTVKIVI